MAFHKLTVFLRDGTSFTYFAETESPASAIVNELILLLNRDKLLGIGCAKNPDMAVIVRAEDIVRVTISKCPEKNGGKNH